MAKTILVIEDETNLVELLKYRLEANGYNVETAFDGDEGLKKINDIKPDLIVLDIRMPKMHGYDVCKLAKENNATKEIPIIMLTAHSQKVDMEKGKLVGADAFMAKPFEPAALLEEIGKLLKLKDEG